MSKTRGKKENVRHSSIGGRADKEIVESFIRHGFYRHVDGQYVPLAEFIRDFHKFVVKRYRNTPEAWPEDRITCQLRATMIYPVGRGPRNVRIVGNLSKVFSRPRRWVQVEPNKVRLESVPDE